MVKPNKSKGIFCQIYVKINTILVKNPKIANVISLRTCIHNVFAMKNAINHPLFKEKTQVDSHSINQVFDAKKQDLASFHAKPNFDFIFQSEN